MKSSFVLLVFSLSGITISAQNSGDEIFVWNPAGLELFSEKDLESKVVGTLQYGERLFLESTFEELKVKATIPKISDVDLEKKTFWLKVRTTDKAGYILGERISTKNPMKKDNSGFEYPEKYFKREYGLKDSIRTIIPIDIEGVTYDQKKDSLTFKNQVTSTISIFDGCTDWVHTLKGWTFFEVYNLLYNSIYEEYDSIDGVITIGIDLEQIDGSLYSFGDGEFLQDAYIKEKENGDFEIGYYYCD
ncbi:MAG: hypothetical protein RIE52_08515 [Balneola sp.]|jgi:hypothetical protein